MFKHITKLSNYLKGKLNALITLLKGMKDILVTVLSIALATIKNETRFLDYALFGIFLSIQSAMLAHIFMISSTTVLIGFIISIVLSLLFPVLLAMQVAMGLYLSDLTDIYEYEGDMTEYNYIQYLESKYQDNMYMFNYYYYGVPIYEVTTWSTTRP